MNQLPLEMEPTVAWAILYADGSSHDTESGFWAEKPPREVIDDLKSIGLAPVAIITIRMKNRLTFEDRPSDWRSQAL